MKKRLISLFVALTMLLCLIPAAFAATFNAGTYTASVIVIVIGDKILHGILREEFLEFPI